MALLSYVADPTWTHAGGVVYRTKAGGPRVLLVRARPAPHDWVLPKGHIERGESAHRTARREVREEAGVEADPLQLVGELEFTARGKRVRAAYFLMRFVREVPPDEAREIAWCSFRDALDRTAFPGARGILRAAASLIDT